MSDELHSRLRRSLQPLPGDHDDYDGLLEQIGLAELVLLGGATHGTHEFYRERARITRRLIDERGFDAVIIEADWPDAYRVNRFIRETRRHRAEEASDALGGFVRFPSWMWRNADVIDFVGWLRAHNERRQGRPVSFLGMDLYSLYGSIREVLNYLHGVDREAESFARRGYACFGHYDEEAQGYGLAASRDPVASCEDGAVEQLLELQQRRTLERFAGDEGLFDAIENAQLVADAEKYYRAMFRGRVSSWNLRDLHMADTVDRVIQHLSQSGKSAKVVLWAHNSHLGDARFTGMRLRGEHNVGQLLRERHGDKVFSVGFTTFTGTVTAASDWDTPAERKRVRPALKGSIERLFHELGERRFFLSMHGEAREPLLEERLQRAIGVIYRPQTERGSHYSHASVAQQFDAVIHIDESRAVEPLERSVTWTRGEPPETFPSAL